MSVTALIGERSLRDRTVEFCKGLPLGIALGAGLNGGILEVAGLFHAAISAWLLIVILVVTTLVYSTVFTLASSGERHDD